jgi:hypothetical protein
MQLITFIARELDRISCYAERAHVRQIGVVVGFGVVAVLRIAAILTFL